MSGLRSRLLILGLGLSLVCARAWGTNGPGSSAAVAWVPAKESRRARQHSRRRRPRPGTVLASAVVQAGRLEEAKSSMCVAEVASSPPETLETLQPLATSGSPKSGAQWLLNSVKSSLARAKIGTTKLWTNFQACQSIRKELKQGKRLTYPDFAFLERGKQDRSKLMNMAIMWALAPELIYVTISFMPGMIPSTFEMPEDVKSKYENFSLLRVRSAVAAIHQLEQGRTRAKDLKKREQAQRQSEAVASALAAGDKRHAFNQLRDWMYVPGDNTPQPETAAVGVAANAADRSDAGTSETVSAITGEEGGRREAAGGNAQTKERAAEAVTVQAEAREQGGSSQRRGGKARNVKVKVLEGVPPVAIKGLGKSLGLMPPVLPAFFARAPLEKHVKTLARADAVLAETELSSLSMEELREACSARCIDPVGLGKPALLSALSEWLSLTKGPAEEATPPGMVFAADRARLVVLGLNVVSSVRGTDQSGLTRALITGAY